MLEVNVIYPEGPGGDIDTKYKCELCTRQQFHYVQKKKMVVCVMLVNNVIVVDEIVKMCEYMDERWCDTSMIFPCISLIRKIVVK